jgi:polyisoprenoid-binding protein YceI
MSMKKCLFIFIFLLSGFALKAQDVFTDSKLKVSFFSETSAANIDAHSSYGSGALNVKSKKIYATIKVKSFEFTHELMQEHFNENYIESDKYPDADFNGTITDDVDLTKSGTYKVTASGKLTMHGVAVDRTILLTIAVNGNQITVHSEFMVHIPDHKITIPTLVTQQIAEDVKVTVDGILNPYTGN